jgi:2-hydroxychromene-2-carboxylate isomerase
MQPVTYVRSKAARLMSSAGLLHFRQARARLQRRLAGTPPTVHYFHQVDDPYSHLAVQKLDQLRANYTLPFAIHLVSAPASEFRGSSEHFDDWALRDAQSIAEAYGATLEVRVEPDLAAVHGANSLLAGLLSDADFADKAFEVGAALWAGQSFDTGPGNMGAQAVAAGNALRASLGHYQGAMFYFDGEWFWGIDRIRSLEMRLRREGFAERPDGLCVPEPKPVDTTGINASDVVLEYFPSLRSPYTAIGHQRVLDLIERSGVTVKLRPVMPMLMRGIPAPREKQFYIISDAGREARERGIPFGIIVDPFGEPVKRAFALFPAAVKMGRGMAFVTAYLNASWVEGVDIADTKNSGLRQVAASAGLEWDTLVAATEDTDWEAVLDDNLNAMLGAGLWGVPSFRVSGGNDAAAYSCWGQDRIWRVENEIARRVAGPL